MARVGILLSRGLGRQRTRDEGIQRNRFDRPFFLYLILPQGKSQLMFFAPCHAQTA